MRLVKRSLLLVVLLFSAQVRAQTLTPDDLLEKCRKLYSTWETNVATAKGIATADPVDGARRLDALERNAGECLEALQNDLTAVETTRQWWEPVAPVAIRGKETKKTAARTVQQRDSEMEKSLQGANPSWKQGATLLGSAIGTPVDYKRPSDYLRDSGTVAKKWSELAKRFAPVLQNLVTRMKPRVGLAIDTRDCRALWLTKDDAEPLEQDKVLPAETRIGFCLQALRNDLETLEKHLRSLKTQPKNVKQDDIKDWGEPSLHGAAIGSVQSVDVDIDKYLVDGQLVHESRNGTWSRVQHAVAPGLGDVVHSIMSFRGLRELLSTLLTGEVALLDMRRDGASVFAQEDTKGKTLPTASLLIESEHFGAETSPYFHFSFGGQLAALPTLNLLKQSSTEEATPSDSASAEPSTSSEAVETEEKFYPTFQQGLVWDLNGSLHSAPWGRLEVSGGVFLGQTILLDDKSLIERDKSFVGVSLTNGTGRAEIFKGWFIQARTYDLDLNIIHGEHSYLNPRFSIAYGERWNDRLVPETGSDTPASQWKKSRLFRFRWNIRNSLASRDKFQKPLLVTFSFGIEREWWPGNAGLPTVTTVFFSGDFDLRKIIKQKE
jgi:hypothetical protein